MADGIGAVVEVFAGGEGRCDESDAFLGGLRAKSGEEFDAKGAFERDEAEDTLGVVVEEEADHSVAEDTDAVVKEDGVGRELVVFEVCHFACLCGFAGVISVTFILEG